MTRKKKAPVPSPSTDSHFLLEIPQAAVLLSTTTFAVCELCRSGELVYVTIGHKWLISPDAIRAFIKKREQEFFDGVSVIVLNRPSRRIGRTPS
jgi:hypothetical protein